MNRSKRCFLTLSIILLLFVLPAQAQDNTEEPVAAITPIPRPFPVTTLAENGVTVELYFENIPQGQAGLVHVMGAGIDEVRARFFRRLIDFFPVDGDGFYGLLSVSMEQNPRVYDLSVFVQFEDGENISVNTQVEIARGQFIRQDFAVPEDRVYLIDPQVERTEFARLGSVTEVFTPEHLWDGTFQYPVNSELTSPYGAFRTMNSSVQTRHTGWDLRAPVGTPVMAMGAGRVAFAGLLDIWGNHIVIDHGYGIYSGYSHLSQVHVTRGQTVVQGQIIGVSGNTGRSNGPHFHWEVVVHGEWVDSAEFARMWLP